uniref:Pectate lyase superfamily protein domain-containing protein n=1 Tax=Acrobeloides nanus TaxID=290746 RepID=A0A914C464_9BILA
MVLKKLFLIFIYVINLIFNIHTQDYNVRDFGAIGDGITDDTNSIRAALQAAANSNGGRVIFDSGYIFFTGCFQIYNNTILDVQGTILGSNSSDHYGFPGINSTFFNTMAWQSLIFGSNLANVTITGGGVIDGQGANWWPCFSDPSLPPCSNKTRPRLIELNVIKDLVIHNVTLQNSPMYNIALNFCDTAHIYDIKIFNPPSCWSTCPPLASHNTDGVNMYVASNVLIENSHISTGI